MSIKAYFGASVSDTRGKKRYPWLFVPSTYFAEGVPYTIVIISLGVMYKNLGVPNSMIGLTSFLYLPWVVKMFWGPLVDLYLTKRKWIILTQAIMGLLFLAAAFSIQTSAIVKLTMLVFFIMAFISATHDIATDGFYMLALSKEKQAFFVGIRSLFYRIAMIFGESGILILTGFLVSKEFSYEFGWSMAMGLCAALFILLYLFHSWYLPRPATDLSVKNEDKDTGNILYVDVFKSYFAQKKIVPIISFILLFRFGEAMLGKMKSPFLLDNADAGGMGLTNIDIGFVNGAAIISLIAGGILGGWLIAKYGLRKCIWPMALALNLPDLLFVYLAFVRPEMYAVYFVVLIEYFGYGFGFTAFMVFLMYVAKGKYKTSHFAISTGLMAFGMMLPGLISGYLQEMLGYQMFFISVFLVTIPGMAAIFFIPLDNDN